MERAKQIENAKKFRKLHKGEMFFLPNAWNGGSAKVFEKQGFSAIGTTSAGIAYSLGYEDGEKIKFDDVLRVVKEIVKVTNLPLTVDIERGYGSTLEEIETNIEKVISLGAVGINIEDGITENKNVDSLSYFIKKVKTIAELREKLGIPFVINARTDIYLLNTGNPDEMLEMTIERAKALKKVGADCIFIPGALDEETIIKLRSNINMPINLFVHDAFNDIEKLNQLGINRLSSGSALVRTTINKLINISTEFNNGECKSVLSHNFSYAAANKYFRKDNYDREAHM